jgi:hypothetical protein
MRCTLIGRSLGRLDHQNLLGQHLELLVSIAQCLRSASRRSSLRCLLPITGAGVAPCANARRCSRRFASSDDDIS